MKTTGGKETNGDINIRKKNAPLTTALDTMSFKVAKMASQHSDRDVAVQLYAIACKMTALSNHLKSDASIEKQNGKRSGDDTVARFRVIPS